MLPGPTPAIKLSAVFGTTVLARSKGGGATSPGGPFSAWIVAEDRPFVNGEAGPGMIVVAVVVGRGGVVVVVLKECVEDDILFKREYCDWVVEEEYEKRGGRGVRYNRYIIGLGLKQI